jgi:hypothetical protein
MSLSAADSAPRQALPCPCGLTQEVVTEQGFVAKGYCGAPLDDGSHCGTRLADHPREGDIVLIPQAVRGFRVV